MKRLMSVVLSMVVVLMMCGGAMAEDFNAQGSTLVPSLYFDFMAANNWTSPYIIISNITAEKVQCRVTMYNHDGSDVTSLGYVMTGGTNWVAVSHGVGDFDLPAYSSRIYSLLPSGGTKAIVGYATIEWKSDNVKLRKALVGGVMRYRAHPGGAAESQVLINHGDPF
ncbi:hypothetical protein [Desulfovibrio gilichinskyi]|uniref:Uncharacterized protein n=1 Tax=Desulfovibrio gilichinskyi TaxID=1519643 RepID=A0A1X7E6E8_9BACT|nr:hypothetical protein [Desulfovibrio gilichinskyi]SMF28353.1 hypothetical protein SAMN06295933_2710 [Desulfovibrio gilichinskyi]